MRKSPSRRSISLKSCRLIKPTRYLIVRTSKGLGILEVSSVTGFTRLKLTVYRSQVFSHACQHFAAVGGDEHVIFDSHATPVRDVDSRLNGDYHARLKDRI